jgi:hypothetical protein
MMNEADLKDVYISYSNQDEPWVSAHLLPKLDEAEVTYIDEYQFVGGRPRLEEIERAIKQTRRTIIVLSPNYLEHSWGHFSAMLVASYGVETSQWLAVPLVAQECQNLPTRFSALTVIDVSAGDERRWQQLLTTLSSPPDMTMGEDHADLARANRPQPGRGQPAISSGLQALGELMARAEVRQAVQDFRDDFQFARNQIQVLADYKDMHDELHLMQKECYQLMLDSLERFPDEEQARSNIQSCELDLQRSVENVEIVLKQPTFRDYRKAWVENLYRALTDLHVANAEITPGENKNEEEKQKKARYDALGRAIWSLRTVLSEQPLIINQRLNEARRDVGLAELVYALTTVRNHLGQPELDRSRVSRFEAAIDNLAELYFKLKALVEDHDKWQEIDIILRRIRSNLTLFELKMSWQQLNELTESMYRDRPESWAVKFQSIGSKLGSAISKEDFEAAKEPFQQYYGHASDRFIRVDKALKRLCGDMRQVGDALSLVLEVIQ